MTTTEAEQIWLARPESEGQLPEFSESKGGRCWPEGLFSLKELEALVLMGSDCRSAVVICTVEAAVNELYWCANGACIPPVTEEESRFALIHFEIQGTKPIKLFGEWCISELDALRFLWKTALESDGRREEEKT